MKSRSLWIIVFASTACALGFQVSRETTQDRLHRETMVRYCADIKNAARACSKYVRQ
jgi:hypothetical protein